MDSQQIFIAVQLKKIFLPTFHEFCTERARLPYKKVDKKIRITQLQTSQLQQTLLDGLRQDLPAPSG